MIDCTLHTKTRVEVGNSPTVSHPTNSLLILKEEVDALFNKTLPIKNKNSSFGELHIGQFLKTLFLLLQQKYTIPFSFDLIGGALAKALLKEGFVQDIDIAIEFPKEYAKELPKFAGYVKEALKKCGLSSPSSKGKAPSPLFRQSLVEEADFIAALLSIGEEEVFWIDLTISTVKKRKFLFRRDNFSASLLSYFLSGSPITVTSTLKDPMIALQDRHEMRIVVDDPEEVNHMGWTAFLLLIVKGNHLDTPGADETLFNTFQSYYKQGREGPISILKRAFANHGSRDSKVPFYLAAFLSLLPHLTDKELQLLAAECPKSKSLEAHFLRFSANTALQNTTWRTHLRSLAYLLRISPWPIPTQDEWLSFLSNLKSLDWIPPSWLQGKELISLAFTTILAPDFPSSFNKKISLDALYKSCAPDELQKMLPLRLEFELEYTPQMALSTYQHHRPLFLPVLRIFLAKALMSNRSHSLFLEMMEMERAHLGSAFPLFFMDLPHTPAWHAFLEQTDILSLLNGEKCPRQHIAWGLTLLATLQNPEKQNPKKHPSFFSWLIKGLSSLKPADFTPKDRETLKTYWQKLWLFADDSTRTKLMTLIKKLSLHPKICDITPFISTPNISDDALLDLMKGTDFELPAKRQLVEELISRKEAQGMGEEALSLYHHNSSLWTSDSEKNSFYNNLPNLSLIKAPLFCELESPPIAELFTFLQSSLARKDDATLHRLLQIGIRAAIPLKKLSPFFIHTTTQNKLDLLPAFLPLGSEILPAVPIEGLSKDQQTSLFTILAASSLGIELLPHLESLSLAVDTDIIFAQFPSIAARISQAGGSARKNHLLFWMKRPPIDRWIHYPDKKRNELLLLLEDTPEFMGEKAALAIGAANDADSLNLIIPYFLYSPIPDYFSFLAIPFLKKLIAIQPPASENIKMFLAMLILYDEEVPQKSLYPHIKNVLSYADASFYLTIYAKLIIHSPHKGPLHGEEKRKLLSTLDTFQRNQWFCDLIDILDNYDDLPSDPEILSIAAKTVKDALKIWSQEKKAPSFSLPVFRLIFCCQQYNSNLFLQQMGAFIPLLFATIQEKGDFQLFTLALNRLHQDMDNYFYRDALQKELQKYPTLTTVGAFVQLLTKLSLPQRTTLFSFMRILIDNLLPLLRHENRQLGLGAIERGYGIFSHLWMYSDAEPAWLLGHLHSLIAFIIEQKTIEDSTTIFLLHAVTYDDMKLLLFKNSPQFLIPAGKYLLLTEVVTKLLSLKWGIIYKIVFFILSECKPPIENGHFQNFIEVVEGFLHREEPMIPEEVGMQYERCQSLLPLYISFLRGAIDEREKKPNDPLLTLLKNNLQKVIAT